MKPSDQIRAAIRATGLPINQIAKRSGVAHSVILRFMAGSGISTETLDKISGVIPMDVVVKKQPKSRNRGKGG